MGYHQNRYSTLRQINKRNVKRLVPVWSTSLEQQLRRAGPAARLQRRHVRRPTPSSRSRSMSRPASRSGARRSISIRPRRAWCAAAYRTRARRSTTARSSAGTLDAHVVALDQKTGKQVWKNKVVEWKEGFSMTGAPQIANGVLITGISGAEFGVRGFLDGCDPETGKRSGAPTRFPAPARKATTPGRQETRTLRGGGSTWITGSYDPELDLAYWGTGNAGPWNPTRAARRQPLHRVGARDPAEDGRDRRGTTSSCRTRCTTSTRTGR